MHFSFAGIFLNIAVRNSAFSLNYYKTRFVCTVHTRLGYFNCSTGVDEKGIEMETSLFPLITLNLILETYEALEYTG